MDSKSIMQKAVKLKEKVKDKAVILLLAGLLLLVVTFPVSGTRTQTDQEGSAKKGETGNTGLNDQDYASAMEARLEEILSSVSGVGKTEVMVTLKSTSEKVVEKDRQSDSESVTEEDSQGGTRSTVRTSSSGTTVFDGGTGDEGESPYVTKELTPEIEGVVVLAQGGDRPEIIQNITGAVQALFSVETHKIKVMKLSENQ